jgi:hypothetical protein
MARLRGHDGLFSSPEGRDFNHPKRDIHCTALGCADRIAGLVFTLLSFSEIILP